MTMIGTKAPVERTFIMNPTDPLTLTLSKNSLHNTTIDCDSADIHYVVSTPKGGFGAKKITTIHRWESKTQEYSLVAEWERNCFRSDRLRLLNSITSEFLPVKDVLTTKGMPWSVCFNRAFIANDGKRYVWKSRPFSLKLYAEEDMEPKPKPVASFHRKHFVINRRNAFIDVHPKAKHILDTLIPTFLYTERRRRDHERLP